MIGISVRDALDLPALRGAELVGGAAGIDRIIQSINIMEVPDVGSYVKPAELLLTTAYPIREDKNAQEGLVPELWKKGLAGLAIKPQRYITEIPEVMIRQADELGFPLIRLPMNASFTEIINPLLMEILNRQAVILQRNDLVSQALAGIMLRGGGLDDIVRSLAGFLELPVSIHDVSFRKMASWLNPRDFGVELNKLLRESVADWRRLSAAFRVKKDSDHFLLEGVCNAVVRPVVVAGEIYAYVFIWEAEKTLSEREVPSVEQAITMIALEINKQRAITSVEAQFKSSFIESIIDGEIDSAESILSRAEAFGWQLPGSINALLFENQELQQVSVQDLVNAGRKKSRMLDSIASTLQSLSHGAGVVDFGNRVMVLYGLQEGWDTKASRKASENIASTCCKELERQTAGRTIVGISRPITGLLHIKEGVEQAKRALEFGRRDLMGGQLFHFDDLGLYRILVNSDEVEIRQFQQDVLGQLISYDEKNESNLLATLDAILASDMNLVKAAERMFIHYNTLRYRMSRIREISGLDLKLPEHRLNLQVALKIWRMKS